jgi:hypothetical protein
MQLGVGRVALGRVDKGEHQARRRSGRHLVRQANDEVDQVTPQEADGEVGRWCWTVAKASSTRSARPSPWR